MRWEFSNNAIFLFCQFHSNQFGFDAVKHLPLSATLMLA